MKLPAKQCQVVLNNNYDIREFILYFIDKTAVF